MILQDLKLKLDIGLVESGNMIKLVIRNGTQTLTEVCDVCKCHITDLSVNDILVKPKSLQGLTVKDSEGKEVTRTGPRPKCYCDHCNHE